MNRFCLLFLVLLSANARPTSAQSPVDTTATDLSEVVVSASRLNQTARELGRNVTVISGKDLSRFPVNSLDDLLRCLPSLEIQSRGSFGAQADITMRGSTFNQVLILIDGMRINDPLTGHFAGYLPITPAEIEQIELIRGAGSALYGPDAVGGIIHIVTKTFSAQPSGDKTDVRASVQRGEWNLWNINAGGFWRNDKLRVGGGVLTNTTTGQPLDPPSTRRNDVDLKTYSVSASYALSSKWNLAARAAFDRRDFNAQWFYTTSTADLSRETTTRDLYQAQLRYRASDRQQTELQFAQINSTDLYVFNPAPNFVPSNHRMNFTLAQVNHLLTINPRWKAAIGGQYDQRGIESNDRGNHQTWHWGLYGVLTAQTDFGLTATGSLRYDRDQSYGGEVLPQLNLSYGPTVKWVLRGSVGRSIRAADFTERYVSNNLPGPLSAGRNIGLASLQAEQALNAELGADFTPIRGITLKATGFLRDGRNLIDYVSLPGTEIIRQTGLTNLAGNRTYRLAQNLFDVQTRGFETELWARRQLTKTLGIDFIGGYTRLSTASPVASQYLANFARHQVTSTLTLTAGPLSWTLTGLYKERNRAAAEAINRTLATSYTVFHSRLEAAVVPRRLFLTAQVHNLFDERYADLLGAQMPRRWLMGGVRVQFP